MLGELQSSLRIGKKQQLLYWELTSAMYPANTLIFNWAITTLVKQQCVCFTLWRLKTKGPHEICQCLEFPRKTLFFRNFPSKLSTKMTIIKLDCDKNCAMQVCRGTKGQNSTYSGSRYWFDINFQLHNLVASKYIYIYIYIYIYTYMEIRIQNFKY